MIYLLVILSILESAILGLLFVVRQDINLRIEQLIDSTKNYWYLKGRNEVSFVGPEGKKGDIGPIGPQGYPGPQGLKGDTVLVTNEKGQPLEVTIRDRATNIVLSRHHPDHPEVLAAQQNPNLMVSNG